MDVLTFFDFGDFPFFSFCPVPVPPVPVPCPVPAVPVPKTTGFRFPVRFASFLQGFLWILTDFHRIL